MPKKAPEDGLVRIYALSDPITGEVRYIGKTVKHIETRLSEHLSKSIKNPTNYKDSWVISLNNKGLKPLISVVEMCEKDCWEEREKYWIDYYRKISRLTNISDGGGEYSRYGIDNVKASYTTEEVREAVTLYVLGCTHKQIITLEPFKELKFRCLRGWIEKENRTEETVGIPTRREYLQEQS